MFIYDNGLKYIQNGLSIHLLKPFEKRPAKNAWSTAPFLTEEEFKFELNKTPKSNIGIRLGEYTKIGTHYLYVLDLDISSNDHVKIKEAYNKLKEIYKDYDKLPRVKSASPNSRHFYFLSKILLKSKKLAHSTDKVTVKVNGEDKVKNAWEIDLCSTGKQVVLPPSQFNGNTYKWDVDLIDYLNNDNKKALMIIDDMSLISLDLDNDPQENTSKKDVNYKIEDVEVLLNKLPENFFNNYDDWLKVGMALHDKFSDTEEEHDAIQAYDEFSKKSDKYKKGEAFTKWKSFTKSENGITLGTLFFHLPKETSEDRILKFSRFLNNNKINFENLKEALKDCELKDYEVSGFIDLIASSLSLSMNRKYTATETRRLINSLNKEIRIEEDELIEKIAIGLDNTLAEFILEDKFNNGKYLLNLNSNVFFYKDGVWIKQEQKMLEKAVLDGIKKILSSKDKKYESIIKTIYKKKRNDNIDSLTNNITSLILKMTATSEYDDILNLKNKRDLGYSVINTLNKEIYIQNGKITVEDHSYDSYLITQFDVMYDETLECPNWIKMLNTVFQNHNDCEEVVRHFCEVLGYIIQSKKPKPMFLLGIGGGSNGKSFIFKEFQKIMGLDSTLNVEMSKFSTDSHAETAIMGKNMIIDDDWKKGQLLPDDYLKKLSEDKLLTANPKFKEQFNFVSRCTPVILANNSPKTKDTSFGFRRRAQVFNFNYQFKETDIDNKLSEKLKSERSGFLNLLIKSYIEYEKRGFFKVPQSCQGAQNEWLKGSNPLLAFLDEKLIITKDKSDRVKAQYLFDMYKMYVENENFSHNMTRNNFYDDLKFIPGLSVVRDSSDKNYYIHGCKMRNSFN